MKRVNKEEEELRKTKCTSPIKDGPGNRMCTMLISTYFMSSRDTLTSVYSETRREREREGGGERGERERERRGGETERQTEFLAFFCCCCCSCSCFPPNGVTT